MKAYMLIRTAPGEELSTREKLSKLKEVTSCDLVRGAYDMIAIIQGDLKTIDKAVLNIRKLPPNPTN
jgi:DNA-binding Lrp family transcriptional regulator